MLSVNLLEQPTATPMLCPTEFGPGLRRMQSVPGKHIVDTCAVSPIRKRYIQRRAFPTHSPRQHTRTHNNKPSNCLLVVLLNATAFLICHCHHEHGLAAEGGKSPLRCTLFEPSTLRYRVFLLFFFLLPSPPKKLT